MAIVTSRRSLITGLISLAAAPAIVRASNLMPVKTMTAPTLHGRTAVIQKVSELMETERGLEYVMQLVQDLSGDGFSVSGSAPSHPERACRSAPCPA